MWKDNKRIWWSIIMTFIKETRWERVIFVYLQMSNFSAITSYILMSWSDFRSVLDQHPELDFDASSLKQLYVVRHVAPLGNIILIPSHCSYSLQKMFGSSSPSVVCRRRFMSYLWCLCYWVYLCPSCLD